MKIASMEELHHLARDFAARLKDPDGKQLRYNEIVDAAIQFYTLDPRAGVVELVASCDRANPALYVKGDPMWQQLQRNYRWMLGRAA